MKRLILALSAAALASCAAAYESKRPEPAKRCFTSAAVEKTIARVQAKLGDTKMAWLFANCFPNTLDTTVHYSVLENGDDDTFVYTGDIHAMWLRDSAAQVWPYLRFAKEDEPLRRLIRGVVLRQFMSIRFDPYANAFNRNREGGRWQDDDTDMKPELHERKYELDSLCYPIRLAHGYWKATGDATIFDARWLATLDRILGVMREQQRKEGTRTSYKFLRFTNTPNDTLANWGYGWPAKPCGLIASSFRPSDDATTFPFLVPSNFFAVDVLRKAAEILRAVNGDEARASACAGLADEVEQALYKYAVFDHPKYGKVFAFEVDGFGNALFIDDANVPSLLALPYFTSIRKDDPIYLNTRRLVWGPDNPYYFEGKAGAGIGGPHCGLDRIWPMSYVLRALTTDDEAEIRECLAMLEKSDAGTGFMHESYDKDDPSKFSRSWFAWANTLFGELILNRVEAAAPVREWRDISSEIARVSAAGGGRVVVPAGEWETGPIHLKSNVELHFEDGADVLFTDDLDKYLPAVEVSWEGVECLNWSPLVYANGATNVAVTGKGVIHPRMGRWAAWLWCGPDQQAAKRKLYEEWGEKDVPLAERDLTKIPESRFRPPFVFLKDCANVRLSDFTLRHSPFWCIHLFQCDGVDMRRVTVDAHMRNNDALDIESTRNVLVEDCTLNGGDDIVCIKSGRDRDGRRRARPTENVVVRRVTADSGHAFLGIGSELSGGVRNILMEDCTMDGTCDYVFRLKTTPTRGGFVENVTMRRIKAKHAAVNAVDFTTAYFADAASVGKNETAPTTIKGVRLEDVFVESAERRVELRALPGWPIEDFVIAGLKVRRTSKPDVNENVPVRELPVTGSTHPADKTCDWRAVHAGYHAIPSEDKSLWSIPGMPHKVAEDVYRDLGAWLEQ